MLEPRVKTLLRSAALPALRLAAGCGMLGLLERADRERRDLLRVLTYHRVGEAAQDPTLYSGLVSATPAVFEGQMRYLAAQYTVLSLPEVLECRRSGRELPPGAVLITFDDGYADMAEHAWPILRRRGLPAVLFVPTAFPDHPERAFWWDRLHAAIECARRAPPLETPIGSLPLVTARQRRRAFRRLKQLVKSLPHARAMALVDAWCRELGAPSSRNPVLGWEALRQLSREGLAICAHTRSHPLLDRISADEAHAEVAGSLADLRRELGEALPSFAYPDGHVAPGAVRALEAEGVELAFTTSWGVNRMKGAHPLLLRRVPVGPRVDMAALRVQLLGSCAALNRLSPLPRGATALAS